MTLYQKVLGHSGKEKLPVDRKKFPLETGSERGNHLPWPFRGEETKTRQMKTES